MASNVTSDSNLVQQFINITGTDETVAKNMLEAFNNNLEMAINMFLEGGGVQAEQPEVHEVHPATYSASNSSESHSHSHKRKKHSKHSSDDTRHGGEDSASSRDHNGGVIIDDDEDEVRAPIPQRQQVLVEDQYHEEYEQMLQNTKSDKNRKRKRLHELFQPPIDLIHLGDFQSARDVCNRKKKWLLVNIQNSIEFACQVVNRDVWSNQTVRDIINANFIMWQVSHDSDEGLHYGTFYSVKRYPHISVIDPRTGERMVVWENFGMKPSADQFAELATHFLSEHPALNDSFESKENDNEKKKCVIDLGEEDQLEAAISASLKASTSENTTTTGVMESDTDETDSEGEGEEDENSDSSKNTNKNTKEVQQENNKATDCSTSKSSSSSSSDTQVTQENGSTSTTTLNSAEKATILLRLPDNGRKQILFPLECTLKDLSLELSRLGWPDTRYEIIKAFPRQNLSQCDQGLTLKEIGLHKQETLFIQDR